MNSDTRERCVRFVLDHYQFLTPDQVTAHAEVLVTYIMTGERRAAA